MVLSSERRKDHQFNTIINFYTLLPVHYIQITQQASVTPSTSQAQPNIYSSSCIPPQKSPSGPTTYTTTLDHFPYTSSYVIQTDIDNAINTLFEKLNDNFGKQHEEM